MALQCDNLTRLAYTSQNSIPLCFWYGWAIRDILVWNLGTESKATATFMAKHIVFLYRCTLAWPKTVPPTPRTSLSLSNSTARCGALCWRALTSVGRNKPRSEARWVSACPRSFQLQQVLTLSHFGLIFPLRSPALCSSNSSNQSRGTVLQQPINQVHKGTIAYVQAYTHNVYLDTHIHVHTCSSSSA